MQAPPQIGVVIIGRNEGATLEPRLASVTGAAQALVYVDGSQDMAQTMGPRSSPLICNRHFPPRGRNADFAHLIALPVPVLISLGLSAWGMLPGKKAKLIAHK